MASGELRQQLDDLALRAVVAPEGAANQEALAEFRPALERIREQANGEAAADVAVIAGDLLVSMREGGSPFSGESLQSGVAAMQAAIENGGSPASALDGSPAQDPELLADFVTESREHLSQIETQVLGLERDPDDSEALNAVFRGFHTIKGLSGFLELWDVQKLAHQVETVLDRARNRQLTINSSAIDVILESADMLHRWVDHVDATLHAAASTPPEADDLLLLRISALAQEEASAAVDPLPLAALAAAVETGAVDPTPVSPIEKRRRESTTVKVDTAKLDYLVDMAGEMVIAESLVRHDPDLGASKSQRLQRNLAQLTRITSELQKTAMVMRLVPIGPLFRRMARLVRDLSRACGKTVEMETRGDDIELDRTIVEELADPLMHMVRNALDHGIETPEERVRAGKSPQGCLMLRAMHHAGQVVIEIADDGGGLDRERIRQKAIQKGLIGPGDSLSDSEIYNLIFNPGFSTAAQVTNVSGRGVGMDVVRKHIEKLRGRIEIRSTAGQGTTFLLKLPLTLAIIDGLVVSVGAERYIVPLFAVREMFRPLQDTMWTIQDRAEMALLRDSLLPVVRLYRRFGIVPRTEDPRQSVLVVAEVEGRRFCLLVDDLIGKQEVMIKALGETFKGVPGIAGGAILGDGRVGLILDVEHLLREGQVEATH